MQNQPRLIWANSSRGVASAAVMLGHILVAVVVLQSWVEDSIGIDVGRPLVDYGLAAATRATGIDVMAAGVCLFFLLSGLVIAKSLERYNRRGFLVGRCLRILPTYAAGYGSILLVLMASRSALGTGRIVGLADLVGLIPGLPTLLQVPEVPNTVAWTLVVEFTFYGLCLVMHRRLLEGPWSLLAVASACVAGQWALLAIAPRGMLAGASDLLLVALPFLPVLLIGVLLSERRAWWELWPAGPLIAAFLWMTQFRLWWPFSPLGLEGAGIGYQMAFVATIGLFVWLCHAAPVSFDGPILRWLADVSYPLYVVHAMLGWIVTVLLVRRGIPEWGALVAAVAVVLLVAWLLHVFVESPTHRWGQTLARRLSGQSVPAVTSRDADHHAPKR